MNSPVSHRKSGNFTDRSNQGFTLAELLVAIAILTVILLLFSQMISRTSSIWLNGNSRMSQFREGRVAFNSLVSRLGEATVNQYFGFQYSSSTINGITSYTPSTYYRRSDLRFISGPISTVIPSISSSTEAVFFLAPLGFSMGATFDQANGLPSCEGAPGLLNICGYYIQWSNVDVDRPSILANAPTSSTPIYRFQLMQFVQPTEYMGLYAQTTATAWPAYGPISAAGWQTNALNESPDAPGEWSRPIANNVVALILLPALSTSDTSGTLGFSYNSDPKVPVTDSKNNPQNRLPPVMRVVLYTIDEVSAQKLARTAASAMPDLYTSGGTPLFQDPTKLYPNSTSGDPGDLSRFETILQTNKLNYHRFETAVQFGRNPWNTLIQ